MGALGTPVVARATRASGSSMLRLYEHRASRLASRPATFAEVALVEGALSQTGQGTQALTLPGFKAHKARYQRGFLDVFPGAPTEKRVVGLATPRYRHQAPGLADSTTLKGQYGEAAARSTLERLGREHLPCKLPSNTGFDSVSIKRFPDGSIANIWITESKFSSTGRGRLAQGQMTKEWVDKKLLDMSRSSDPELVNTAQLIKANESKVFYRGNVLGPDGVNSWKPLTQKINRLHAPESKPRSKPK